jgi:hypothetical protein
MMPLELLPTITTASRISARNASRGAFRQDDESGRFGEFAPAPDDPIGAGVVVRVNIDDALERN